MGTFSLPSPRHSRGVRDTPSPSCEGPGTDPQVSTRRADGVMDRTAHVACHVPRTVGTGPLGAASLLATVTPVPSPSQSLCDRFWVVRRRRLRPPEPIGSPCPGVAPSAGVVPTSDRSSRFRKQPCKHVGASRPRTGSDGQTLPGLRSGDTFHIAAVTWSPRSPGRPDGPIPLRNAFPVSQRGRRRSREIQAVPVCVKTKWGACVGTGTPKAVR